MIKSTGNIARNLSTAGLATEFITLIQECRWLIIMSAVLIVVDFWLGVSDSIKRGEPFRRSKAIRRSLNKAADHICYLLLGGVLGKAFGEPYGVSPVIVASIVVGMAQIAELSSIAGHHASLHGYRLRFDLKKFVIVLVKQQSDAAAEALEESLTIKKEESKKTRSDLV